MLPIPFPVLHFIFLSISSSFYVYIYLIINLYLILISSFLIFNFSHKNHMGCGHVATKDRFPNLRPLICEILKCFPKLLSNVSQNALSIK